MIRRLLLWSVVGLAMLMIMGATSQCAPLDLVRKALPGNQQQPPSTETLPNQTQRQTEAALRLVRAVWAGEDSVVTSLVDPTVGNAPGFAAAVREAAADPPSDSLALVTKSGKTSSTVRVLPRAPNKDVLIAMVLRPAGTWAANGISFVQVKRVAVKAPAPSVKRVSTLPAAMRWARRKARAGLDEVSTPRYWSDGVLRSGQGSRISVQAPSQGEIVQGTGTPNPSVSVSDFKVGTGSGGSGVQEVTKETTRFKAGGEMLASWSSRISREINSKSFFWVDSGGNPIPIPMNSAPIGPGSYTNSVSGTVPDQPGRYTLVYTMDGHPQLYKVVDVVP